MNPWLTALTGGGPYDPAKGNVLATNPEAIIPSMVAAGVPPPAPGQGVPGIDSMGWGNSSVGGASPGTPLPGAANATPAGLASALSGVKAPASPEFQRISSPPPYRPTTQLEPAVALAALLQKEGENKKPPTPLRLGQVLPPAYRG